MLKMLKNMKSLHLFAFFFICLATIGNAQTADNSIGKMVSINENKVYLSFDKPYYTAGETMYFKAFLTDATTHTPDSAQTIVYVEFIETATKRLIVQQKIKMQDGHGSGSFFTEGSSGTVFVHAYTQWMGNLSADFHFNKNIQIFAPKDADALQFAPRPTEKELVGKVIKPAAKLNVPEVNNDSIRAVSQQKDKLTETDKSTISMPKKVKNLQFFPESGNILLKFANRIAFKATDKDGKGISVKGVIKNEKGEQILTFEDTFLGMGRFNLVFDKAEKFTAEVQNEDGTTSVFPLPNPQTKGAAMLVEQKSDTADVNVVFYFSYDSLSVPNYFYVIAQGCVPTVSVVNPSVPSASMS